MNMGTEPEIRILLTMLYTGPPGTQGFRYFGLVVTDTGNDA